jgi:hypothetical protein
MVLWLTESSREALRKPRVRKLIRIVQDVGYSIANPWLVVLMLGQIFFGQESLLDQNRHQIIRNELLQFDV